MPRGRLRRSGVSGGSSRRGGLTHPKPLNSGHRPSRRSSALSAAIPWSDLRGSSASEEALVETRPRAARLRTLGMRRPRRPARLLPTRFDDAQKRACKPPPERKAPPRRPLGFPTCRSVTQVSATPKRERQDRETRKANQNVASHPFLECETPVL